MKCTDMNQINEVMKQLLGADSIETILTPEEMNALWTCSYQYKYGVFIRLELMTGIRLGELVVLRWDDISYDGVLNVDKTMITLPVSYTHLRAHETPEHLVCRLLLEKKKKNNNR